MNLSLKNVVIVSLKQLPIIVKGQHDYRDKNILAGLRKMFIPLIASLHIWLGNSTTLFLKQYILETRIHPTVVNKPEMDFFYELMAGNFSGKATATKDTFLAPKCPLGQMVVPAGSTRGVGICLRRQHGAVKHPCRPASGAGRDLVGHYNNE